MIRILNCVPLYIADKALFAINPLHAGKFVVC